MTSADTPAASLDPQFAESERVTLRRFLAPFAVGVALLSTFLTFVGSRFARHVVNWR